MHIKERLAAAIRSISDIRLIHRMSLETAMKLFRTKVLPTLTYLGITLQVSGTTFSVHIKEGLAAAIRSISDIRLINRMSLETAMILFRTKVLPTLTC